MRINLISSVLATWFKIKCETWRQQ